MEETKRSVAYFCHECGSPSVTYSPFGGAAECRVCGWTGSTEKLLEHKFSHERGSDTEILYDLSNDIRKAYGLSAKAFGDVLIKWGFFDGKNVKQLSRYMVAMATASVQALLKTRADIEKERGDGH